MLRKVLVEGEATPVQSRAVPVVAKAYHLRVTMPSYPEANRRNLMEGNLIAHVMDHLAAKRYGQAADVLAQRYTALEASNGGITWERAKYLELVGEEDNTLVGQHERALVANETARSHRVDPQQWGKGKKKGNPFAESERSWGSEGSWSADKFKDKDKGKGKYGKGRNKDKDKDKGK